MSVSPRTPPKKPKQVSPQQLYSGSLRSFSHLPTLTSHLVQLPASLAAAVTRVFQLLSQFTLHTPTGSQL